MTGRRPPAATEPETPPGAVGRLGLVLITLAGGLAGLIEMLLVPTYLGGMIFPIAVALALITNIVFPRIACRLVPTGAAALAPFALWLLVVIGFGLVARPEGDVLLPGGDLQWVSYGLLLAGGLAGVVTVLTAVPRPPRPPRR